jgi:hypothetical protein
MSVYLRPFGVFEAYAYIGRGITMVDLLAKLIISIVAIIIFQNLMTEGRLTFAVAGAGVATVAGREIRWAAYAYRPNRTYWRLAITRAY